jgi:hypothetical protein
VSGGWFLKLEGIMWIAKGILLGVWLFSFGWLSYLVRLYLIGQKFSAGRGPGMFGIELLLPVSTLSFWLWLVAWLAIGLATARSFPVKPILWTMMAVTELVPAGLLAMILVLMSRLRAVK